jgi:tetratricopeptide (TPR) repeat protein
VDLQTNQEYDLFLSYSTADKEWVRSLASELEKAGLTIFYDEKEIKPADNFVLKISEAIEKSRFLVLVLSASSISRPWVMQEWSSYMALHGPQNRIIPVRLDDVKIPPILAATQAIDCGNQKISDAVPKIAYIAGRVQELSPNDPRRSALGRKLIFQIDLSESNITITESLGVERVVELPWHTDANFANALIDFWKCCEKPVSDAQGNADIHKYARIIGDKLFTLLFPEDMVGRDVLLENLLKSGREPAVILIRSDNDFIHSLPWELLFYNDRFLVRDACLDIVRTTLKDVHTDLYLSEPKSEFKLLVNVSAPIDSNLNYEVESYRIVKALLAHKSVIHTELGTLDDLLETTKKANPPVTGIHFSGHGSPGVLNFEDSFGDSQPVEIDGLSARLRQELPSGLPSFLYLASCHGNTPPSLESKAAGSLSSAMHLHNAGIAEVVGYFGPIQDSLSTAAEAAFYNVIALGEITRHAIRQARHALIKYESEASAHCRHDNDIQTNIGDSVQALYPFSWAQLIFYHRGPEYPLGLPIQADVRNEPDQPERELTGLGRRKLLKSGFIGRRKELHRIRRAIRDGQRAFVFQGLGGLGKTTLAWKAIPLLAPEQNTCIIWCHETETETDQVAELTRQLLEYCRSLFSIQWEPVIQAVDHQVGDDSLQRFIAFLSALIKHFHLKPFVLYLDNLESLLVAPHKNEIFLKKPPDPNTFAKWRSIPLQQLWQQLLELAEDNKVLYLLASCRYQNDDFQKVLFPISPLPVDALYRMTAWFRYLGKLHPAIRLKLAGLLQGHPRAVEFCEDLASKTLQDQNLVIPDQAEEQWNQCLAPVLPQVSERLWDELLLNQIWEKVLDEPSRRMLFRMTLLRRPWDMALMEQLGEPGEPRQSVYKRAQKLVQTSLLEEVVYPNSKGKLANAYMLDPSTILFIRTRFIDSENLCKRTHLTAGTYLEALAKTSPLIEIDTEAGWHLFQAEEYDRSYELLGSASNWLRNHGRVREGLAILLPFGDEQVSAVLDKILLGRALGTIGLAYASLGEVRKAVGFYEQCLIIHREIGDKRGEGHALGNLGAAYYRLGEVRKAIGCHEQALAINREIGDKRGEGVDLGNLGLAYADLGEVRKAIGCHEQALGIDREIGDKRGEGADLGNLGAAFFRLGEVRKAIGFYEQALAINREIGDKIGEGVDLGNLGLAYANLSEVRKAIGFYEQYLDIAREIGDQQGEGNALGNLGSAYRSLGDVRKAIGFYEQAMKIVREIGHRRAEGSILGNLGIAYSRLGEVQKAIGFYEQRIKIAREIGDREGEGNALFNWARTLIQLEEKDKAKQLLETSLAIGEEIESPGLISNCKEALKALG